MTIKELKQKYPNLGALAESLYDPEYFDSRKRGLDEALDQAFDWEETEQGFDYWDEVYNGIQLQAKEDELTYVEAVKKAGQQEETVEKSPIEISEDYWVVETDAFTYGHVIKVDHLDDNNKAYFDIVQNFNDKPLFIRMPKSRFRGMYQYLKTK